ncbi:MAG TPA: glycosyltransferase family 1 protein, partial [Candidatus Omnitrophota bacterium]|nr:glycosyltransferase family 1 protein [Candidatus Omnitrophota bacterium]
IFFESVIIINHLKSAKLELFNTKKRRIDGYPGAVFNTRYPTILDRSSIFWMTVRGRAELSDCRPDVFWGSQGFLPLRMPEEVAKVITVHDAVYYACPETMSGITHFTYQTFLEQSIRKADAVVTVSRTMKEQLEGIFLKREIRRELDVVYPGVDDAFRFTEKSLARECIAGTYRITRPYLLFVGTCEPRKNLVGLIRAFRIFLERNPSDHQLLIVGAKGWKDAPIYAEVKRQGAEDRVRFLGYVPQKDLPAFYSAADAFVFVPFYEGFGIPNLEAMACGVPIIASDIPVFREVLNDAAFFVRPEDPRDIADGIQAVLLNTGLRNDLVRRGAIRARAFSWPRSSEAMLDVFRRVLKSRA